MVEAMPQPLGTVHKCLENGAPYGGLFGESRPPGKDGRADAGDPLLTWGALELQAFLALAVLIPAQFSVLLSSCDCG